MGKSWLAAGVDRVIPLLSIICFVKKNHRKKTVKPNIYIFLQNNRSLSAFLLYINAD